MRSILSVFIQRHLVQLHSSIRLHKRRQTFFQRSQQGGFVDKVFQVGTGEARGGLGDGFQADIGAKGLFLV